MTSLDRLLDYAKTRGGDLYVLTRNGSWSSALGEERIFQDGPTLLRSLARCECERLRKGERPGVSLVTISPEEDGVAPEGQSAAYVPEQAPRWLKDYHLAGKVALYFGRGSSELSPSARSGLDRIVRELRPLPGAAVAIQAWADSLTGSRERNELLSEERYQAIHRYLARALGSDVRLITGTGLGQAAERRADVYLLQPPLRTGNGTR
jgi:outer membrane protein OmpA-like peptidoglycan-associated protein